MVDKHANAVDNEKAERPGLQWVPSALGRAVAAVLRESYSRGRIPYNWRVTPISYMEMIGAIERHIAAVKDRKDVDEKSKLHPLKHIAASVAILLDALEQKTLKDDRPTARERSDPPNYKGTLIDRAELLTQNTEAWVDQWMEAVFLTGVFLPNDKDMLVGMDMKRGHRAIWTVNKMTTNPNIFDCGECHEIVQVRSWR